MYLLAHLLVGRSVGPLLRFACLHLLKTINVVQEWTDVLQTALSLSWSHVYGELAATEVITKWSWWIQDKAASGYQSPAFFEALLLAD